MTPDPVLTPCPKHRRYWVRMSWSENVYGQEEWAVFCPDDIRIGTELRAYDRRRPRVVERKWARP